jgi:membrane-associated phospholipid phosphatase
MEKTPQFPAKLFKLIPTYADTWRAWWSPLSPLQKIFPIVAVSIYWVTLLALQGLRADHLSIGVLILALSYLGPRPRMILHFLLPYALTIIVYDSQRFYSNYLRGPIHVTEPYYFDQRFFGISTPAGILTPNEWWQLHTYPLLDFVTGLAYLFFFTVFIFVSAYFGFYLSRVGTAKMKAPAIARERMRMPWSFFWLNMLGYTTYYWYAAAPPWYVAKYGLGPAQLGAPASQAGCVRFDQLFGTHFFSEMYGRAADVFGAIPSLHVAYPLLAILFAFRYGALRTFCILFYALMCFSAIYLNHHYVLDILWGSSYALLVGWVVNRVGDYRYANRRGASAKSLATR